MAQDLKYIITTEPLEVPINIVHFKENNAIVFPLLLQDYDFKDLAAYADTTDENAYLFFDLVLHGAYTIEYPMRNLFQFLIRKKLKTFGMVAYREILDIPENVGKPIVFINDQSVKTTSKDFPEDEAHQLLNVEVAFGSMINNEEKYWSYETAEFFYLNDLKNQS
ncbi:MAG: hypothetical protein AAF611_21000 [Bacteroidota bacterium]